MPDTHELVQHGGSPPLHPAYCYPNYVQHQHQTPELVYHNQYDPQQQYFDQNQNFAAMRESETWYHQSASTAYQPSSVPIAMKPETEEDQPLDFSVTASTTAEKRPSSSGKEIHFRGPSPKQQKLEDRRPPVPSPTAINRHHMMSKVAEVDFRHGSDGESHSLSSPDSGGSGGSLFNPRAALWHPTTQTSPVLQSNLMKFEPSEPSPRTSPKSSSSSFTPILASSLSSSATSPSSHQAHSSQATDEEEKTGLPTLQAILNGKTPAGKQTRPFKAYPRDPLSLSLGVLSLPTTSQMNPTELLMNQQSNQQYVQFRSQMLASVQAAKRGRGRPPTSSSAVISGDESSGSRSPEPPEHSQVPLGVPIPLGKDQTYWERRRKNNEAAKRSRDARRAKEDEIAIRAAYLEQENLKLRVELAALKTETTKLRCMLYNGPQAAMS